MADVFLSYSRRDKALAGRFVELLEAQGWDVFWDQETRAGTLWPKVLEDELNQARCLIVLWTANSVKSRWVRIEAYEALQNDKLLPVRIESVKPPMEFRQTQTIEMIGWSGEGSDPRLPRLFEDLRAIARFAPGDPRLSPEPAGATAEAEVDPACEPPSATPLSPGARSSMAAADADSASGDVAVLPRAERTPKPIDEDDRTASLDKGPAPVDRPATASPYEPWSMPSPERVDHGERRASTAPFVPSTRVKPAWAVGIAVAVVAGALLARAILVPDDGQPGIASKPEAAAVSPESVRPAITKEAAPPPSSGGIVTAPIDAAATTTAPPARTAAADPPPRTAATPPPRVVAPPARTTPARCVEIADKFQTTGQLTEEERRFLGSKECAR